MISPLRLLSCAEHQGSHTTEYDVILSLDSPKTLHELQVVPLVFLAGSKGQDHEGFHPALQIFHPRGEWVRRRVGRHPDNTRVADLRWVAVVLHFSGFCFLLQGFSFFDFFNLMV